MAGERPNRASDLYHEALRRPFEERAAFIREACGADVALRVEVESLLAYEPAAAGFLELPAPVSILDQPPLNNVGAMLNRELGPYTIIGSLGVGGMGEVYRARDNKLGRDVAIKILPSQFIDDPERRARFAREARLLATLSHPNIGAIYGLDETDGITALVLELVEGPTLAGRLEVGPIPIEQALSIARQIAGALAAAHEKGIVHRDLKPSNIVVHSASGAPLVKVLDFGLAKAVAAKPGAPGVESTNGTADGWILGTPAYMSPEQARGEIVDKRTDIWSFGCVLFELLTGTRAFEGKTITDTLAQVLDREPDWSLLPSQTPTYVRTMLAKCLRKDRHRRLHDIADALLDLEDGDTPSLAVESQRPARNQWSFWAVAGVLLVAALWAIVLPRLRAPAPASNEKVRFTIEPPQGTRRIGTFALSPDGRHIAFITHPDPVLRVRSLDSLEVRAIPGTEGAAWPFWKPDSQAIGFFAGGQLKTVALSGGAPVIVCPGRGQGAWNDRDLILFGGSPSFLGGDALQQVNARGGIPSPVTSLISDEYAHGFPAFLPDNTHFLYLAQASDSSELRIGSLASQTPTSLGRFESNAQYAAGYLFFVRGDRLIAQAFDTEAIRLIGSPVQIAAEVGMDLIRFGGHLPKGGYDVLNGGNEKPTAPSAIHG